MVLVKLTLALISTLVMATAPGRAEVRIGFAAPLTGPMAWAGASTQRGVEMAVADLNQTGGVLNEQLEIVTADDYCEGEQAVAAAKKLVEA